MAHFQQTMLPGSQWMPQNQPCWSASTFRDLMQAIPRPNRHASRISKPRSAGNSPSSSTARRTAQYQPPRPASAYNAALLAASMRRPTTRPTSWHPATFDSSAYCPPAPAASQYYATPTTSASFGDATMLPQYALSGSSFPAMPDSAPMDDESFLQQQHMATTTNTTANQIDPMAAAWDSGALTQPMPDSWSFDMMSMTHSIPCADLAPPSYPSAPSSACLTGAPSTPDGLFDQPSLSFSSPVQNGDDNEPGDELVGMGLYSNPDAPLSSLCGKGLKLEETFTPSDSDDKDAEADDDDDSDDEPQEQTVPPHSSKPPPKPENAGATMAQKSFFDQDFAQPVVGAQQLFNLAQPCMNYGYGWI
ncbi:uncharacterized protein BDW47DRAFT_105807 [Aspergillus candidus]|uniref:Uncharacterized protein n=1 Tax=Aspergillus candidus TaxID=41067 RepID=A0A2I2FBU4_ASPCN|nr:hypothetical protein BDW47DRAFT_105807 [Aspergillus candidus]PLB38084.1 hypothetical protein BDW47DRAFT_105807 [Aspergillus candidus]